MLWRVNVLVSVNWLSLAQSVVLNGALALVPVTAAYAFRNVLDKWPNSARQYAAASALGLVWFVFLPNTCYLLTEWRHFLATLDAENMFLRAGADRVFFIQLILGSLFYFMYSSFGMVAFTLAVRPVERAAIKRGLAVRFWAFPFFAVVSLGVYLGLVLRLNSWDLVTKPTTVWQAIVEVGGRPMLAAFILAFGVFLWIAYEILDIWIDGLKLRLASGKSEA
jgi:uncharacterized membrane protein